MTGRDTPHARPRACLERTNTYGTFWKTKKYVTSTKDAYEDDMIRQESLPDTSKSTTVNLPFFNSF